MGVEIMRDVQELLEANALNNKLREVYHGQMTQIDSLYDELRKDKSKDLGNIGSIVRKVQEQEVFFAASFTDIDELKAYGSIWDIIDGLIAVNGLLSAVVDQLDEVIALIENELA